MTQITLYGYAGCKWCLAAKIFLTSLKLDFVWRDIRVDPFAKADLDARAPGWSTVPQIFAGDDPIGGYDALSAAWSAGRLNRKESN